MASLDSLKKLYEHVDWANERVHAGLAECGAGAPEALELLAHVVGAELVWLARLRGEVPATAVWPEVDAAECVELIGRSRAGFARLFAELDDEGLQRSVAYENSAGRAFETTVEDILLHVVLHGAYHRGQVAARLAAVGAEATPSDYIAWVRGAPAATRDDARSE